jgi:hypothetical protein
MNEAMLLQSELRDPYTRDIQRRVAQLVSLGAMLGLHEAQLVGIGLPASYTI